MKLLIAITMVCLSACSWFGSKRHVLPYPTEIIVTGAPEGSMVFVDGLQAGHPTAANDHPQILEVAAGAHKVEIHVDDRIVYREETEVAAGERRVITVLSGLTR